MNDEAPPELRAVYAPPEEASTSEAGWTPPHVGEAAAISGYRVRTRLLRTLQALMLTEATVQGLNFAICVVLWSTQLSDPQNDALSGFSHSLVKIYPAVYWTRLLFFAWFLVGSNKNARAFLRRSASVQAETDEEDEDVDEDESEDQRVRTPTVFHYSPASMVWWFVVPLFNLFKPYSAVTAVWNASRSEHPNERSESRRVLWQWWVGYLLGLLFSGLGGAMTSRLVGITNHNLAASVANLISGTASLLTLRMVMALHTRQSLRAAELWPASARPQPISESSTP